MAEVPPRSASRVSLPPPSPQWGSQVGSDPASAPRLLICKIGTATTPAARTAGPQSSGAGGEWEPGAGGLPAGAEEGARWSPGTREVRLEPKRAPAPGGRSHGSPGARTPEPSLLPPGGACAGGCMGVEELGLEPRPSDWGRGCQFTRSRGDTGPALFQQQGHGGVSRGSSRDLLGPRGGCSPPPHAPARPELHLSPWSLCGWGRGGARAADCAENASEFYRQRGVGAAGLPAQPLQPPEPPAQPP